LQQLAAAAPSRRARRRCHRLIFEELAMSIVHRALARILAAAALAGAAAAASAQVADQPGEALPTIVITSQHLNEERSRIDTQTGASTYTFKSEDIQAQPGGENRQLNQVMLQVPDAAQDSFGQLHIRGDHNGLQFRLNGVILPDGISVFGQTLPPRMISEFKVITGSLPAQFGLRSAGIIDLTTKGGALQPGGEISLYGGSHNSIQPSFNYGGSSGNNTFFVTGDYLSNDLGIESPDGSANPLHNHTNQYHGFGYFEHIFDDSNRLSVMAGGSDDHFQIPNLYGVHASDVFVPPLTVNGQTDFLSQDLNENQREITYFGALSLQHSHGPLSMQTSLIARYSSLEFSPDPNLGDLFFNGISQQAYKRDVAYGLQSDGAYKLNDSHTLRAGIYVQSDHLTSNTTAHVLPTDVQLAGGMQTSDVPLGIIDNIPATQWIESAYLQDEYRFDGVFTVNYGLRFDHYSAFSSGSQLSPRINFVWQASADTTVHAGYSRFFSPPPFELIGNATVEKFFYTTAAPAIATDSPVKPERSNYYDLGIEQTLSKALTVGVDSYYKQSSYLIDEGQFGAPIILTPFNYRYGQVYGVEFTANYTSGHFQAYGNLAVQRAIGKDIVSSEFNFSPDDLAYIAEHYIHLDHEQQMTASGGAAWLWRGTRISGDLLVGSGLRSNLVLPDGSSIPNGDHLPYYMQVNAGISHAFSGPGLTVRFDVINVFDEVYQIRNGTGVGVGAPQYGPRRGFFAGVSKIF
jgi:outer membrane receptor for ferrienterochelin and colicins